MSIKLWRLRHPTECVIIVSFAIFAGATAYFESAWGFGHFLSRPILILDYFRAFAIYGILFCALGAITRKPAASAIATATLMICLGLVSQAKFSFTMMTLHSADLYYFLIAPAEVSFFFQHYWLLATSGIIGFLLLIGILVACFYFETKRPWDARLAAAVVGLSAVLAGVSWMRTNDKASRHFFDAYHMTSLFTSLPELGAFVKGPGLPYDARSRTDVSESNAGEKSLTSARADLNTSAVKPNIIVVLHESAVNPAEYKSESKYHVPRNLFQSGDGRIRKLIVETWGGGTWLSEHGFLLGVSTHYFGNLKPYLGFLLEGKVHHSLAFYLKSLGYHSTKIYPAPRIFANAGKFYKSLGFDEVLDSSDINQLYYRERDEFYYNVILGQLRAKKRHGDFRPSFYFVATSATHSPYNVAIHPTVRPNEIVRGDDWAEYARRLRMSLDDLQAFKATLKEEFDGDPFLIVGFGDHQPHLTRDFVSRSVVRGQADVSELKTSSAFNSFFRVEGINFSPDYASIPPEIEIGFLSTAIVQAARLPADEAYRLRIKLMRDCRGLMFRCGQERAVEVFHKALVERGDLPASGPLH